MKTVALLWLTVGFSASCSAASSRGPSATSIERPIEPRDASGQTLRDGVAVGNVSITGEAAAEEPPKTTADDLEAGEKASLDRRKERSDKTRHAEHGTDPSGNRESGGSGGHDGLLSGKGTSPGSATTSALGDALSAGDVDAALAPQLRALRACATSDSSVSVRLAIAPGGKVAEATATRSTPDDARLRDCVEGTLRTLSFRTTGAARGTALSFDLALKPFGG